MILCKTFKLHLPDVVNTLKKNSNVFPILEAYYFFTS